MKSLINIKSITVAALALCLAVLSPGFTLAQENSNPAPKEKSVITIHISKDVNGEIVKYDTTFEADNDFDVEAFLDKKDLRDLPPDADPGQIPGNYDFELPKFEEDFSFFPDSVEFDTLVLRLHRTYGDIMKKFPAQPGFRWNDRFENPGDEQEEAPVPDNRNKRNCPPGCPFGNMKAPEMMPPQFPGQELAPFIGNSRPEKMVIHEKRHGKKVVIKYEDDDDIVILPNDDRIIYREEMRHPGNRPEQYRKQKPGMQKEMEYKIQKGRKDNNERKVIIIEKKSDEDKE
jgi:hypothetical protein